MSGSLLEMQFTKAMKDPSGKQAEFSVKKGITPLTPVSISVDPIVPEILALYLSETIAYGDVIKVSYTKGTIESVEDKLLESFTDANVVNLVPSSFIQWTGYPASPYTPIDYPYQSIFSQLGTPYLMLSKNKQYYKIGGSPTYTVGQYPSADCKVYQLSGQSWSYLWGGNLQAMNDGSSAFTFLRSNADIYTDTTLSVVRYTPVI